MKLKKVESLRGKFSLVVSLFFYLCLKLDTGMDVIEGNYAILLSGGTLL